MGQWLRFEHDNRLEFGTLQDGVIRVFQGDMFAGPTATGRSVPLSDVRVRTPCDPSKMICLWNNFHELAAKLGSPAPDEPLYLLKAPSAFAAHGDTIHRPKSYAGKVVYEGELGIVIGRRCRRVTRQDAAKVIAGYLVVNDVTVRDWQFRVPTWTMGKSFDTHGPTGPWIVTGDEIGDPHRLALRTWVNGDLRQSSNTKELIFDCFALVEHLSTAFTLEPGDIISTGTPAGVGVGMNPPQLLKAGDIVRIEIEDIGEIENEVVEEPLEAAHIA